MDSFQWILAIFLLIYVAGILVLGFIVRKKASGLDGFLVAKRKLPILLTTLSLTASIIGASMTFVSSGLVFGNGLSGMWFTIGPAVFLFLMGLFLAKKIRASKALTLPDLVGKMFDTKTRVASAVLVFFAEIAWVALLALASQWVLTTFLGFEMELALALTLIVFTVYTLLAGKVADAYTDLIQFIMMAFLMIILIPMAIINGGGEVQPMERYDLLGITGGLEPVKIFGFFILLGLPYLVGPDVYSAILSSGSEKIAKKSAMIGGCIILIWGILIAILGMCAYTVTPGAGSAITAMIDEMITITVLKAIMVGCLIAVIMSSLDTTLLTGSSTFANDILGPILENVVKIKKAKREFYIRGSTQISVIVLSGAAYLIAVEYADMLDVLQLAYTVFVSGMILPVAAGFFKEKTKVTNWGAMAGLIVGGGTALIWLEVIEKDIGKVEAADASLFLGLGACLIAMVAVSLIQNLVRRSEP